MLAIEDATPGCLVPLLVLFWEGDCRAVVVVVFFIYTLSVTFRVTFRVSHVAEELSDDRSNERVLLGPVPNPHKLSPAGVGLMHSDCSAC